MSAPNRKKLIRKQSSSSISNTRRNHASRMGRPQNKEEENLFMEELKRCAPGINLELEIQVLVWLRYFRVRGVHQSSVGLADLYKLCNCSGIYDQLLGEDYLEKSSLSAQEEARFTSNVDCQFMLYYVGQKNGKAEWTPLEVLMVVLALLKYLAKQCRWRKLVNEEVMQFFQKLLPSFERLALAASRSEELMDNAISEEGTEKLLQQKLGDLVRWLIDHMGLQLKLQGQLPRPVEGSEVKKQEDGPGS